MKIWFFNHYALPPNLHPLTRTYNFAKQLKTRGYEPVIFAASTLHKTQVNLIEDNSQMKIDYYDGIKYIFLRARNYSGNGKDRVLNMFDYFFGLFKASKKIDNPDVIFASSVHPFTCVAGIRIAKKKKCKCIVEIADLWPRTLIDFGLIKEKSILAKLLFALEFWIYKNADEVIFTMEGGEDYIKETFGVNRIDNGKVHYINNGVNFDEYISHRDNFNYEDVDLDNNQKFKVIYTGSLGDANAIDYILEAAHSIQRLGYKNIQFLIFGDGIRKNELIEYCSNNEIRNVIFKGRVDKKYIPNILSKGNLNIFTGRKISLYRYGLSLNKLFDYLASGKPIVSNIKSGYDIITKYNCGISVDDEKSETFANAIIHFAELNKDLYIKYCDNALNAAKDFDFRTLTDELERVIK